MSEKTNIKLPSRLPRFMTALQFGFTLAILLTALLCLISIIHGDRLLLNTQYALVIVLLGTVCSTPFFYVSNKRLGIDELRKGEYVATHAYIVAFNDDGILLKVDNKQIAISKPLVFGLTYEDLQRKDTPVLYLRTHKGREFITSINKDERSQETT